MKNQKKFKVSADKTKGDVQYLRHAACTETARRQKNSNKYEFTDVLSLVPNYTYIRNIQHKFQGNSRELGFRPYRNGEASGAAKARNQRWRELEIND